MASKRLLWSVCVCKLQLQWRQSFAAAAFKLGWFLYIYLPKAVSSVKHTIENESLKWVFCSFCCCCWCVVDDLRAIQAAPGLQCWASYVKAKGMIPSLQLFDFYLNVASGLELSLSFCRQCQAPCCYGAAAWSILGRYFTANLIQHNLHLPKWL